MLPYGLDSYVTKLQANLLTKPSVFIILSLYFVILVEQKILLLLFLFGTLEFHHLHTWSGLIYSIKVGEST